MGQFICGLKDFLIFKKEWNPKGSILCSNLEQCGLLGRGFQSGLLGQGGGLVGGLPGELRLGAAEVAIGGGLLVDGAAQVQALDNLLGREREVLAHQFGKLCLADLARSKGIDAHADRLGQPMA